MAYSYSREYGGRESYGGFGSYNPSRQQGSLLQVVIRKLVDSIDEEERRQHYEEIIADLNIAEENMDTLVHENQEKLHSTLSTFGKIDSTIKECQMKVRMLKDNLETSKNQLYCKRETLKRLYFDEIKHRKMLKLLDQIDDMKHVPEQLQQFRNEKKYYEATELLKNSVSILEGELSKIEALKELRAELKQLKEGFHEEIIEELQYQLYTKAVGSAYQQVSIIQVPPSLQHSRTPSDASARSSPLLSKRTSSKHGRNPSKSGMLDPKMQTPPPIIEYQSEDEFAVSGTTTEEPALTFLGSLVESLSMLGKVPEMLDAIQRRMLQELVLIVEKASIRVTQMAKEENIPKGLEPSAKCTNSKYLQSLLEMCFRQFDDVVLSHSLLLKYLKKAKQTYKGNYELYDEAEVWTAIQHVLRDLLEIYLAVDEEKPQTSMSAFSPFAIAGHEFLLFKRRVPTKTRKQPLFRFDNSRHAISVSSYIKEQRDKELASQVQTGQMTQNEHHHHFDESQPSISQHLVCKPSTRNITVMYSPVRDFVLKIEDALQLQSDAHCELYRFLQDLVEHKFLDVIHIDYQEKLANATKPEARVAVVVDLKVLRNTNKPALLTSSLVLWDVLKELQKLMTDMPMYSANFLSLMLELLQTYYDVTFELFKENSSVGGAQSPTSDKVASMKLPTISSRWAQSEDIVRLLTSFSSWQNLHKKKNKEQDMGIGKDSIFSKESDNLLSSLSSEIKQRSDIIQSHESFKMLSVLHESIDWFAGRLEIMTKQLYDEWVEGTDGGSLSRSLSKRHSAHEQEAAIDNEQQTVEFINQVSKCLKEFQDLSRTTILCLHLELRCHCFYYLIPTLKQSVYVCEHEVSDSDSGVKELGNDLKDLKVVLSGVLTSEKQNYLFDGLGHLIAAIFINSTSYLKKININGVKKMCRNIQHIQSCLSKITSIREKDLDLAQKYFAMLYVNEEEFLKLVMEQGKLFNEKDYINALTLLSQSQFQMNSVRLDQNIKKLQQMFAEDAC